jgi:TRAP-type mannitol/chloroaromatic compound transport system permease small subunit
MRRLLGVSAAIDAVTGFIGRAVSWLILATVLISAGNAIIRKAFDVSSNAWLELQWYLFGAVFLLAAAYTFERNDHIRIDILSGILPRGVRNAIDLLGHFLMLMPLSVLMVYESFGFVRQSYLQQEYSANAGGLIVWPAKALIFAGFFLLALQGISEIIKRIAVMRGIIPDPHGIKPSEEALAEQLNLVQGRGE